MDHLTIPIPEGMDERQKSELAQWLSQKAMEAAGEHLACEDDPAFFEEAVAKVKKGMAEVEAGQVIDGRQALREIADEFGINLPQ